MGGILGDNLVARVIASQKLPRDSGGDNFCRETLRCLAEILWNLALWMSFEGGFSMRPSPNIHVPSSESKDRSAERGLF